MMKKATKRWLVRIFLFVLAWFSPLLMLAQGWPANYGGVMLQGFYWDSYSDTKWTNLTSQADELSKYFDIIWVPNSGTPGGGASEKSMGYNPCFWLTHNTVFGTESQLKTMISTFKSKGTTIMMDLVVNHKSGQYNWCDFPTESKSGYSISWSNSTRAEICSTDECNRNGYKTTGAADTGEDFDGSRDLDHTSTKVQKNIKTYMDFLVKEIGYGGFRFDMVKGYSASYAGNYARSAGQKFNVGEYWDGDYNKVVNWINGTGKTLAAFDYPLKYRINAAYGDGNWSALSDKGVAGDPNMSQYAVTFVDNHDTFVTGNSSRLNNQSNWLAANALILGMPGTPCILLSHWQLYKEELKKMIDARKAAGVTNTSKMVQQGEQGGGYIIVTQGTKGRIMVVCGYIADLDDSGWTPVSVGNSTNQNYAFYINNETGFDPGTGTGGGSTTTEVPDLATWQEGKTFAYFEAPTSWNDVKAWAWNDEGNLTGEEWPGTGSMTKVSTNNGNNVWLWTADATVVPTGLLFNGNSGADQTSDFTFSNGGYYTQSGLVGIVTKRGTSGGGTENPDNDGTVKIYVKASAAPYLYAWEEGGGEITSGWPGDQMTETETVSGTSYYVMTLNKKTVNIILNNGNGGQTADITGVTGTVYYEYDGNATAKVVTPGQGGGGSSTTTGTKVYVKADAAPYLYVWDADGSQLNGAWPGTQMSQTETVDGVTYYVQEFEASPINIIFNNGNGAQTADIVGVSGNVYYEYDGNTTATKIGGGGGGTTTAGTKVYVKADAAPYLYAWDSNNSAINGQWPGTLMSETATVDGVTYYVKAFEASPINIIFNNGNGAQTADIKGVSGEVFYSYDGSTGYEKLDVQGGGGDQPSGDLPACATYQDGKTFAYFETSWSEANVWAFTEYDNFQAEWPGEAMTNVGTNNGKNVFQWIYNGSLTFLPEHIIFNNGSVQTADLDFVNGGYYTEDGTLKGTVTNGGGEEPQPGDDNEGTVKVYVKADAAPYLYAWEEGGGVLTSEWPGDLMSDKETVSGTEYYVKTINKKMINLILNNGNGGQTEDIKSVSGTVYYQYDGESSAVAIKPSAGGGDEPSTDNKIKVYVKTSAGANIYAWTGSENTFRELTAQWPGDALSATETVNGASWYVKEFNADVVNVVLNSGEGAAQSQNFEGLTADTFIEYNFETGDAKIADGSGSGETPAGNVTIYVKSSDPETNIYAWDEAGELTAPWPGDALTATKKVNGEDWYYKTFDKATVNVVINNNAGATQSADFTGLTEDTYLVYNPATGETTVAGGESPTVDEGDITVYVNNAANIYAWAGEGDSFAELTSTWPGDALSASKTVDGKTWYYVTFDKSPINVVLNSGEGAAQSKDITGITKDIYLNYDMETGEVVDVTDQINPGGSGDNKIPSCAVYVDGKTFAYFEASNGWTSANVWAWTEFDNFNGTWPGTSMTKVGKASNGNDVFQWLYDGSFTFLPEMILFNDGNAEAAAQTDNFVFTNGGYYTASGLLGVVTGGISGDLNGDGKINVGDIGELYKAILSGKTDSKYDINSDGSVNSGDVGKLYSIILNAGN